MGELLNGKIVLPSRFVFVFGVTIDARGCRMLTGFSSGRRHQAFDARECHLLLLLFFPIIA